jgi:CLIP-associating protein 1/2
MARLAGGLLVSASGPVAGAALRDALSPLVTLLDDPSGAVRDAALAALQAAHRALGAPLRRALDVHSARMRPAALRDILGDAAGQFVPDEKPDKPPVANPAQLAPASSGAAAKPARAVGGTLRTAPNARDAAALAADAPRALATAIGDDGLVHPQPVRCASERELASEVEALLAALAATQEWDVRMAALARLEGLVMGGAARVDGFQQALRSLRDALLAQLSDRRSSVVKQACHLLVVLAAALGAEFEPHAEALLPAVFGVVIITIKVMSDAGVACVRGVLRHCPAPKLAVRIAEAARGDRNAKLRAASFEWLAVALEEWGPEADAGLERVATGIEDALKAGVADADSDARALARRGAAAYARRWPDAFARLCARADGAAGRRLRAAAAEEPAAADAGAAARNPRLFASSAVSNAVAAARAAARARVSSTAGGGDVPVTILAPPVPTAASPKAAAVSPPGSGGRPGSSGGSRSGLQAGGVPVGTPAASAAALRSTVSDVAAYAAPADALVPQLSGVPLRRGSTALPRLNSPQGGGGPVASRVPTQRAPPPLAPPPDSDADDEEWAAACAAASPATVSAAAGAYSRAGTAPSAWSARAAALAALRAALARTPPGGADGGADATSAAAAVAEAVEDAHQRVALCGLEALAALSAAAPRASEAALERLLPGCFARLVDVREALRGAASAALAALGEALAPEALLPPLGRLLERAQQPRQRTGILEFALHALVGGVDDEEESNAASDADMPDGFAGEAAAAAASVTQGRRGSGVGAAPSTEGARGAARGAAGPGPALRAWAARCAPLTSDKHAGLRNAAVATLVAIYEKCDAATVVQLVASAPPGEQASLRRTLGPYLPGLDSAVAAARPAGAAALPRLSRASSSLPSSGPPSPAAEPSYSAGGGPRRSSSLPVARGGAAPGRPASGEDTAAVARVLAALGGAGADDASGASPQRKTAALADVRRLAASAPKALWADCFAQLLVALLEALADADVAVREAALLALRDLALHQPALCGEYLSLVAPRALAAVRDGEPAVSSAADAALDALFSKVDAQRCVDALRPLLPAAGAAPAAVPPSAARVVRCLSAAVQRAKPAPLQAALPALLPPLFAAFNAETADVRKAVVFCLVDLYLAIGEPLMPALAPLSSAQAKLLQIYIQRATQPGAAAGNAA